MGRGNSKQGFLRAEAGTRGTDRKSKEAGMGGRVREERGQS